MTRVALDLLGERGAAGRLRLVEADAVVSVGSTGATLGMALADLLERAPAQAAP